ncbi:MAG TPA: hypothetical protein VE974_22005 [Thermoanaerobaculia bacterium]|nr:hypothetical protein [Thermoanaerobaculia bacterium]
MRVVVSVLCALFLALPAIAVEKKSGAALTERGVTSYLLESTANANVVRVELRDRGQVIGTVTVETRSADDHIITYEPLAGEAFVIDALMSRSELTFRTAHERVTARFDKQQTKWNRTGSDSLYRRIKPEVDIAGRLLVELQERGVVASPAIPQASSDAAKVPCSSQKFGGVSSDLQQDPGTGGDTGSGSCSGISYDCSAAATSATMACNKAKASCNQLCWNQYCVGCCGFTTCASSCESVWCGASVTGRSCRAGDR